MALSEVRSEVPHPLVPCIPDLYAKRDQINAKNIKKSGDVKGAVTASTSYDKRLYLTVAGFEPEKEEGHLIWRPDGVPAEKIPTEPIELAAPVIGEMHEFFRGSIPAFLERMPVGPNKALLVIAYKEHKEDLLFPLFERSMLMVTSAHVFFRDFFRIEEGKDLIKAPLYEPLGIYLPSYTLTVNLEAAAEDFLRRMEIELLSLLKGGKSLIVLAAMAAYDMTLVELARGYNRWLTDGTEIPDEEKTVWPPEKDLVNAISKVKAQRLAIGHYLDELVG
ncbi:MAG: hypothetical protein M1813_009709 [Trichoglossum hirsutum]|nr:MAG: hypothetical protein M1813_009709 [Trichoglossum hirsutum]